MRKASGWTVAISQTGMCESAFPSHIKHWISKTKRPTVLSQQTERSGLPGRRLNGVTGINRAVAYDARPGSINVGSDVLGLPPRNPTFCNRSPDPAAMARAHRFRQPQNAASSGVHLKSGSCCNQLVHQQIYVFVHLVQSSVPMKTHLLMLKESPGSFCICKYAFGNNR